MRYTKAEVEEAYATLRQYLRRGSTVYVTCDHVARSGMSRRLRLRVFRRNEPISLTWAAAAVLGCPMKDDTIVIGGCGMDMGFHTVYSLARTLWPKGGKLPKGAHGRNGDTSGFEPDGGYLLTHRWM